MSTHILLYFWSISFLHCCWYQQCVVATIVLLPMALPLPLPLSHLYYNSLSNAASAMLLALPLLILHSYCNSVAERSNWKISKINELNCVQHNTMNVGFWLLLISDPLNLLRCRWLPYCAICTVANLALCWSVPGLRLLHLSLQTIHCIICHQVHLATAESWAPVARNWSKRWTSSRIIFVNFC